MDNLVIFGAGDTGKLVFNVLGGNNVRCFADNFPKSDNYCGKPVISFEELKTLCAASPDIYILVASYDYADNICARLKRNGIGNYFVWPRECATLTEQRKEEYHYIKLLEDYNISAYHSIALYTYNEKLPFIIGVMDKLGLANRVKYFINGQESFDCELPPDVIACEDIKEIEENIDLLILDIRRNDSKLHDYTESTELPFDVADLRNFEIFVQNPRITEFKGKHKGQRCFIIGNGPSLTMNDLYRLHRAGEICIGTNKIYHAFQDTRWRPDYYVAQDMLMIKNHAGEIYEMDVPHKFIADSYPPFWGTDRCKGIIKFHIRIETYMPNMPGFSSDFSAYSAEDSTVTYSVMQLAAYMGFSNLYLLGMDFDYSHNQDNSENHFSPKYVNESKYNLFRPEHCALAYKKAEQYSRRHGFRIYNATRGGKLEVFERVDFDSLFN